MALTDFWNRLRTLYRRHAPRVAPVPPPPKPAPPRVPVVTAPPAVPPPPPVGPLDMATKVDTIARAARNLRLLDITYNGVQRFVEPYSMREKWTGLLFFGHCSIHNRIHSFKPEKIERITVTDIPFSPRWDVEFS